MEGAIAASAPVWSFLGEEPPADPGSFARGVTFDATSRGGASTECAANLRAAWAEVLARGADDARRATLPGAFRLCDGMGLDGMGDVYALMFWLQDAFDFMAMVGMGKGKGRGLGRGRRGGPLRHLSFVFAGGLPIPVKLHVCFVWVVC